MPDIPIRRLCATIMIAALAVACAAPTSVTPSPTLPAGTDTPASSATATSRPTATLTRTAVPTPTLTSTATPVATAALPPQPAFDLPQGLTLEEWELRSMFIPPDPFAPVAASMESVLERHHAQRALVQPGLVDYNASEGGQLTAAMGSMFILARVEVVMTDAGYKEQLTVSVDDRIVLQNPPETRGVGMLDRLLVHDGHWYLEVTHARPVSADIELVSDVIRDGQSLSQALGYDEVFGIHLIADAPFFFYRRGEAYGLWYDGVAIPTDYSGISHHVCCAGGPTNPLRSQDMVAFFVQRGETWFYVELGAFVPPDATPTPEPDPTALPAVYPPPMSPAERVSFPAGQLCPNLTGAYWPTAFDRQTALDVLDRFVSDDVAVARSATDPAYWPRLDAGEQKPYAVAPERYSDPQPTGGGLFAGQISSACPAWTNEISWRVLVCPDACTPADLNSPDALPEIVLLNRYGHWLVWATHP